MNFLFAFCPKNESLLFPQLYIQKKKIIKRDAEDKNGNFLPF
jgi:hypothetical protein